MRRFRLPANLIRIWTRVRSLYWLIPAVFVAGCVGLAYLMLTLDIALGHHYIVHLSWVYTRGPDGARSLLSVISQSMVTVAGVVFSITVVALTLATNQFGTRVLRSFARDKGNQVVLGILLGTFLYGIIVMRRVEHSFVPSLSVAVSILLAIVSTAALVYFIHHIIVEIQAENVVGAVARDLYSTIDVLFPEQLGESDDPKLDRLHADEAALIETSGAEFRTEHEGYVRSVDPDRFMRLAEEHDAVVRLLTAPGAFVNPGALVARYWCAPDRASDVSKALEKAISIGNQRTYEDDLGFGLQQLSLIAVRSLSPAINALGTALDAIDRLAATFVRIGNRRIPSSYRRGKHDRLRVITPAWNFDQVVSDALDPVRYAGGTNPTVVLEMMRALSDAADLIPNSDLKCQLWNHVDRFAAAADNFSQPLDRVRVREFYEQLRWPRAA